MKDQARLSQQIWGIPWEDLLPLQLTSSGITIELSTYQECLKFTQDNFQSIYGQTPADSPFHWLESNEFKNRYYQAAGDFFAYKHQGRLVGSFVGTPHDWSTYYLRSTAILPEFTGNQLLQKFFTPLFDWLAQYGVERVEADTAPSNLAIVQILTRFRFNATGMLLSERWGSMLHFTKFLSGSREKVFLDQFCASVRYQERHARRSFNHSIAKEGI